MYVLYYMYCVYYFFSNIEQACLFVLFYYSYNNMFRRWNHTDDYFKMDYSDLSKLDKPETTVTIDINNEEFKYMTGCRINKQNCLPAAGYLLLIWQMMGRLRRKEYTQVPVVFEDVEFLRAIVLSSQNPIDLSLTIQKGNVFK